LFRDDESFSRWLNLEATSRVISRCCNWSFPTGTNGHRIIIYRQPST
jgi:hypothetical protein